MKIRTFLVIIFLLLTVLTVGCGGRTQEQGVIHQGNQVADAGLKSTSKAPEPQPSLLDHLHSSDKKLPEKTVILNVQKKVLSNLGNTKVQLVKKNIHETHLFFEIRAVYPNEMYKKLRDPKNPGWVFWERTGTIEEIPGYTEKVENEIDANVLIQRLENCKKAVSQEVSKEDITTVQKLIRHAVDKHDVLGLAYAHQILHDLDYWILNYPIHYPKVAPPDWKGVETYFGVTKSLEGAYPLEIEELLKN